MSPRWQIGAAVYLAEHLEVFARFCGVVDPWTGDGLPLASL